MYVLSAILLNVLFMLEFINRSQLGSVRNGVHYPHYIKPMLKYYGNVGDYPNHLMINRLIKQ